MENEEERSSSLIHMHREGFLLKGTRLEKNGYKKAKRFRSG